MENHAAPSEASLRFKSTSESKSNSAAPSPWRVVLDSNVWIDILVFDDPATRPIRAALEARLLEALIDRRCLAELTCVLDYPQFARFQIDKAHALATVARLSTFFAPETVDANAASAPIAVEDARPLPKCRDRDDQKFIELAHASKADWLVSKDRAVLKLAKRVARDFAFRIAEPKPFVAAFDASREPALQPASA